jgi:hypothetical protein
MRVTRTALTSNLLLAIGLQAAYLAYGCWEGLPVDQRFLGMHAGHLGRGRGPSMPAWAFPAIADGLILTLFLCGHYGNWEKRPDRAFCAIFALVILLGLLVHHVPRRVMFEEDAHSLAITTCEQMLLLYIAGSHLLYAPVGPNKN